MPKVVSGRGGIRKTRKQEIGTNWFLLSCFPNSFSDSAFDRAGNHFWQTL
jgi:hypothetical protein